MKILIPIPSSDFDPTEVAVPWSLFIQAGLSITFATPNGEISSGDPIMLTGKGLGLLAPMMMADSNALKAYEKLLLDPFFRKPLSYDKINTNEYQILILPGGHAPGMKSYLESAVLQSKVAEFFSDQKIVGAICHGVVLAARSKNSEGRSVLFGKITTALPKWMELNAWLSTCLWLGNYYRTYSETVQSEVTAALKSASDFKTGPLSLKRDNSEQLNRGYIVKDNFYISARWPGDAHLFAHEILRMAELNK